MYYLISRIDIFYKYFEYVCTILRCMRKANIVFLAWRDFIIALLLETRHSTYREKCQPLIIVGWLILATEESRFRTTTTSRNESRTVLLPRNNKSRWDRNYKLLLLHNVHERWLIFQWYLDEIYFTSHFSLVSFSFSNLYPFSIQLYEVIECFKCKGLRIDK